MILSRVVFIFLLFISVSVHAGEFQFTAGASSTTYDDVPEANTWGISTRMQYNFSVADSGWILNYYAPAENITVGELGFGYLWKSDGPFYFEGGLGASYSRIWGPRPMIIVGVGYRLSDKFFIDLPVMFTSQLTIMPYIGMTF